VLVTLDNQAGFLKPGMNGEATVTVDRKENVLVVPNDALRTVREARTAAGLVGLNPDSVQAAVQAQMAGAFAGGASNAFGGNGAANGRQKMLSKGEVDLAPEPQQQGGAQGGQRGRGFGGPLPEVTDQDCAKVQSAMAKKPEVAQQLQALRGRMQSGELDFQGMRTESDKLYASLGVDANVARACQFRNRGQGGGAGGGGTSTGAAGAAGGATPMSGRQDAAAATQGGAARQGGATGALQMGGRTRSRTSLVFVQKGGAISPKVIRVGAADFDYTEVVSGLAEGDSVVMLANAAAQAARDSMNNRFRQMGGGGIPGMQRTPQGGTTTPAPTPGGGAPPRRP